jgi:hypothetical protein
MVRPTKDLKGYQNYIIELFVDKKLNYNEIASHLRRYKGKNVKNNLEDDISASPLHLKFSVNDGP